MIFFKIFVIVSCLIFPVYQSLYAQPNERSVSIITAALKKEADNTTKANLLLELALAYIHKPGEEKTDLDTALFLISQAENINSKILHDKSIEANTYFAYSNAYRERGDTKIGQVNINKAINIYEALSLPEKLGDAYMEATSYYQSPSRKDNIIILNYYDKALSKFKLSGNKEKEAFVLKNLADYNIILRNYGRALVQLNESLNIYKSIQYRKLHGVYDLLNLVNVNLGDYPTAVQNGLLAEKTALQERDTTRQLCTIYYRLALAYNKWYNYNSPEAAEYYKRALDIALKLKDYESIQFIAVSLCNQFVNLRRPDKGIRLISELGDNIKFYYWADSLYVFSSYIELYREAHQLNKAKVYADYLVLILSDPSKDLSDEQPDLAYRGLIDYFITTHQYKLAAKYASINLSYCLKNSNKSILAIAYSYKSRTDSAIGDFKSALNNYKAAISINDSLFNDNKTFQFAQMQVAFNTKQKEDSLKLNQRSIKMLTAKNEDDLKKAHLIRNIIIASALSLLIVLFAGYQFKQKSNRKLQAQQKEINHKNEILQQTVSEKNKLIEEKEWLVKEIHHRVKNNLQIVVSLLNTQAAYLQEGDALMAIHESRHRMQVISLLHQKLYQVETSSLIDMQAYISEVVSYLKESFKGINHLYFEQQIDSISLDISQAVPVGLILNEAITNCIKYAFPNNLQGNIAISFTKEADGNLLLTVADNGIGMAKDIELCQRNSLGMRLMQTLSQQLDGNIKIESKEGAMVKVCFKQQARENIAAPSENIINTTGDYA
ncbi:MAG: sensor histidine kinase [Ferruginibacter sp.]